MARRKRGRRGIFSPRPTRTQRAAIAHTLAPWIIPEKSIPSTLPTPADVDRVPENKSGRPLTARPSGARTSRTTYRKLPTCKD